jgi:hypothetical protein
LFAGSGYHFSEILEREEDFGDVFEGMYTPEIGSIEQARIGRA